MYFTKGKQRAFELLMQQKPGFDRYQSGCAGDDEDCGTCRFYRPGWKYEFAFSKSVPIAPARGRGNARQHGQIDGQKPLCHAALQTRKRQRAYCNTKTAENGFLIVHADQERK